MKSAIKVQHEWAIAFVDNLKSKTIQALKLKGYDEKIQHLYDCFISTGIIERDLKFRKIKEVNWSLYYHALGDLLCSPDLMCMECGDRMEIADDDPEYFESLSDGEQANYLAGFERSLYCHTCKMFADRDMKYGEHHIPSKMLDAILLPSWPAEKHVWKQTQFLSDAVHTTISKSPKLLYELHPRRFEMLVASLWKEMGFDVELTPFSKDGGVDIIARLESQKNESAQLFLIECKRYKSTQKVGVRLIRELYGVKFDRSANAAVLVTTSSFTRDAQAFAKRHYTELQLKDFNDIMKWTRKYVAGSNTIQFNNKSFQKKN